MARRYHLKMSAADYSPNIYCKFSF